MKRHAYRNKAPYSTLHPDARHWTRKGSSWKQKVGYDTEDEAWEFLEQNPKMKAIGAVVYSCPVCNKFHVSIHYKNDKRKNKQERDMKRLRACAVRTGGDMCDI